MAWICLNERKKKMSKIIHYENLPMQYIENFFKSKKMKIYWKIFDIFNSFAQNMDCGYTSINLCFRSKIRKIGIPLQTPVLLNKSGVHGGIHYTDMFS